MNRTLAAAAIGAVMQLSTSHVWADDYPARPMRMVVPFAPGVPPLQSALPGFETDNWYALFVPAGTPGAIVSRLNGATVDALRAQDVRDFLARDGAEPLGSTAQQMKHYFASETAKYAKLVRASEATVE